MHIRVNMNHWINVTEGTNGWLSLACNWTRERYIVSRVGLYDWVIKNRPHPDAPRYW